MTTPSSTTSAAQGDDRSAAATAREPLVRVLEVARSLGGTSDVGELLGLIIDALRDLLGAERAMHHQPAEETGGDACDVFDVPGFGTILFIADATGRGLGPVLSVTQARAMVRVAMRCGVGIEQAVRHINAQLCEDLPPGRFITAFLGRLDVNAHRIEFHSAGQGPLLHCHAATGQARLSGANGLPLGIIDRGDVEGVELGAAELAPGDVYAVLSDGFFEGVDAAGQPFGNEAIVETIRRSEGCSAGQVLSTIVAAVKAHCGPRAADDDRTALVIRRLPEEG